MYLNEEFEKKLRDFSKLEKGKAKIANVVKKGLLEMENKKRFEELFKRLKKGHKLCAKFTREEVYDRN